jgi:hypothetical protein
MRKLQYDNNRISKRALFSFTITLLMVTLLSFIIFGILPVRREVAFISGNIESGRDTTSKKTSRGAVALINEIREREHYASFLNSTLQLSRGDSITFFIDLNDSLAILSFKGVSLFETKISHIKLSNGLKKLPPFFRDSLYSGPMEASKELSSVEKYPIILKQAPKDTIEANNMSSAELPTLNDVFYAFIFDNNLIIEVQQEEKKFIGIKKYYRNYKRRFNNLQRERNLAALRSNIERGYIYHLTIRVPRDDARSIYRALPLKPSVVVRY